MQNLWFVIPAFILGAIIIVKAIDWACIDSNSMSKTNPPYPIPKPKPKLDTFRIAPSNVVDMFYVEKYSCAANITFGYNPRIGWHRVQNHTANSVYPTNKKFTEREAELYIKERLDQREAARIRNEALREFQSRNPPREVPPFHLLENE